MKIAIVCAPGVGDALIMQIVSHHLALAGFDVQTLAPHNFGRWFETNQDLDLDRFDLIFLQHDNTARAKEIHALPKPVYTFYGSHKLSKHGPLRIGFDYVCDLNRTMVDNAIEAVHLLFQIQATPDNGLKVPEGLVHRKYENRVVIHPTSALAARNWPMDKFIRCAQWLEQQGFEPKFLPRFPSLDELMCYIYESGYFLGNDSGPGHIASNLNIPHLIIGREERHMRHWRPGWKKGEIITPPTWVPNWKWLRTRERNWKHFITTRMVINSFKDNVLSN